MQRVRIKICGLYRDEDIDCVNALRPDYAGFVFYPPSHRYVTREQMARFRERLASELPAVGVFVDEPEETVAGYLKEGLIQIAQLHGQESEDYLERLRALAPGAEIWKAFRIREASDLIRAQESGADRVLLDNGYGTGRRFDWRLMEDRAVTRPYLLAGGLTAENMEQALAHARPWGVDISSGAETERKKDPDKIRRIIGIVRRQGR